MRHNIVPCFIFFNFNKTFNYRETVNGRRTFASHFIAQVVFDPGKSAQWIFCWKVGQINIILLQYFGCLSALNTIKNLQNKASMALGSIFFMIAEVFINKHFSVKCLHVCIWKKGKRETRKQKIKKISSVNCAVLFLNKSCNFVDGR